MTALTVLVVGACTGEQEPQESPTATSSPTTSPSPTPTPTPEPTAEGPVDRSDPELGIVFEELPEAEDEARAALDTLTLFEVEFWRAQSSGTLGPELSLIADDQPIRVVRAQVDGNNDSGWTLGGTIRITAQIEDSAEQAATGTVCRDFTDVVFTHEGTEYTAEELDLDEPEEARVALSRSAEDGWVLTSYTVEDTC